MMDVEQAMKHTLNWLRPTTDDYAALTTLAAEVRRLRGDRTKCVRCGQPATCNTHEPPPPRCVECDAAVAREILEARAAAEAARRAT